MSEAQPVGVPVCHRHPDREAHIRCQRCERPICPDCMVPAAVGFQCPDCVAQGRKETRSGRTPYGGLRPTNASLTCAAIIAVNLGVWIAVLLTGGRSSRLVDQLALSPLGRCVAGAGYYPGADPGTCGLIDGASWVPGVAGGAPWQLVTSMFTHVDLWHVGFNMLALWILGPQLELLLGRARFLALYVVSGLAGGALVMWAAGPAVQTIGASGAVYGLMGALLLVALRTGGDLRALALWIGLNFVITLTVPNISWQGHLGGFLGGLAAAAVIILSPRGPRRATVQWAGLAGLAVVVLVAIAARVLVLA